MNISFSKFITLLAATLALGLASSPRAAESPATIKLPLSHVESIDPTNMTFTVKMDSTNLTVHYSAKTRFFIKSMPVISKDLEPADHVSGTLRAMTNGVPEAVRINIVKLAPK